MGVRTWGSYQMGESYRLATRLVSQTCGGEAKTLPAATSPSETTASSTEMKTYRCEGN